MTVLQPGEPSDFMPANADAELLLCGMIKLQSSQSTHRLAIAARAVAAAGVGWMDSYELVKCEQATSDMSPHLGLEPAVVIAGSRNTPVVVHSMQASK